MNTTVITKYQKDFTPPPHQTKIERAPPMQEKKVSFSNFQSTRRINHTTQQTAVKQS